MGEIREQRPSRRADAARGCTPGYTLPALRAPDPSQQPIDARGEWRLRPVAAPAPAAYPDPTLPAGVARMSLSVVLFAVVAAATAASALGVVFSQNIVRAAVWLLFTLVGVAVLYLLLGAEFVGAAQTVTGSMHLVRTRHARGRRAVRDQCRELGSGRHALGLAHRQPGRPARLLPGELLPESRRCPARLRPEPGLSRDWARIEPLAGVGWPHRPAGDRRTGATIRLPRRKPTSRSGPAWRRERG